MAARTLFPRTLRVSRTHRFLLRPLAQAVALAMLSQGALAAMPGWMHGGTPPPSQGGSAGAGYPGGLPPGTGVPRPPMPTQDAQLRESMRNLGNTLSNIAAAQARHAASRRAAYDSSIDIPDGLGEGGLQIDRSLPFEEAWRNAKAPVQTIKDGNTEVTITQTDDKAILNWETFNVGRDTTVNFEQEREWAVLNRVNDAQSRPSQILGQVKGDGTVMIVNRNGVIFTGTSQVNVRNLVAAATQISDEQFSERGIYASESNNQYTPSFTAAGGNVVVEAGAEITTHNAEKATEAGGYVMLLGREVHNAGRIVTANGQVTLAAGDEFVIRRGYSTDSNPASSTRGNEVGVRRAAGSDSGLVTNSGILQASTGDVTLAGHQLRQDGVIVSSTSVDNRGTVHLLNSARDNEGSITFGQDSVTAILVEDSDVTGLDAQKDAGLANLDGQIANQIKNTGDFDLYSGTRTHGALSRVEVVTGGEVNFEGGSTTLATGGHITVDAPRTQIRDDAVLDVSGATGVVVSMESNSIRVNVQGFEQRESPVNRDEKNLNSKRVWIDLRDLVFVPSGTNGYDGDRWYTAGGLLEVGGHVANLGRGIGEWLSQGGSLRVSGKDLVTEEGSRINLSGGTLQVQTGYVYKSYLKGADGKLYDVATAPGDVLYTGLYQGFERRSERWGHTDYYWNPMVASQRVLENGYTVGRDAGQMMVSTETASLSGDLIGEVYQGDRQIRRGQAGLESFYQSQNAIARGAELIIGKIEQFYDKSSGRLVDRFSAVTDQVTLGGEAADSGIHLDGDWLDAQGLSRLRVAGLDRVSVEQKVSVADGGSIQLLAPHVRINADLVARSGRIEAGNISRQPTVNNDTVTMGDQLLRGRGENPVGIEVAENVVLDASGRWMVLSTGGDTKQLAYRDGGDVLLRSSGDTKLADGSVITVSSGGGFGEAGKRLGGRGGNVTLGHIELGGDLELNGEIEGYGVDSGGTLTLISSRGVVISENEGDGQEKEIKEGEKIGAGFRLTEDVTVEIKEGERLPFDVSYRIDSLMSADIPLSAYGRLLDVDTGKPLVLQGEWIIPPNDQDIRLGGTAGRIRPGQGAHLKAGDTITSGAELIKLLIAMKGFPSEVFPAGIPFKESVKIDVAASKPLTARDVEMLQGRATARSGDLLMEGMTAAVSYRVNERQRLDSALFATGFKSYQVHGRDGVHVAEGMQLHAVMPVFQALPGGGRPAKAELEPLYQVDGEGRVKQRGGADLMLTAGSTQDGSAVTSAQAVIHVAQGAELSVDPGARLSLQAAHVNVAGTLRAPGGDIELVGYNPRAVAGLGVLVAASAVLDASGDVFKDTLTGTGVGQVRKGGRIRLGGDVDDATGELIAISGPLDFATRIQRQFRGAVVVDEGAQLLADGAQGRFTAAGQESTADHASAGGSISVVSGTQINLDGALSAASGGMDQAGGRLAVAQSTLRVATDDGLSPLLNDADGVAQRDLVLARTREGLSGARRTGVAELSLDQVEEGGFSRLTLLSAGAVLAKESLVLSMSEAVRIFTPVLAWSDTEHVAADSLWKIEAPYVHLGGLYEDFLGGAERMKAIGRDIPLGRGLSRSSSPMPQLGRVEILADNIDLGGYFQLGGVVAGSETRSFSHISLRSAQDIRWVDTINQRFSGGDGRKEAILWSDGNLTLAAQRIYPSTGVSGEIIVVTNSEQPSRSIVIEQVAGALQHQKPYSVLGRLVFDAPIVDQGGTLYAPWGNLTLKGDQLFLRSGSLTSVSSAGLRMPFGGTVDGESWLYAGEEFKGAAWFDGQSGIDLQGSSVAVEHNGVVDLSGGGELVGAGFLAGRGGSSDARFVPLVQVGQDGFYLPGLNSNPIYALVPSMAGGLAPIDPESGAVAPLVGQQVTIGAGVPGLPAGTYWLMPSTYAILPGAFRVEINGGGLPGRVAPLSNGVISIAGVLSTYGTGFRDDLPRQLLISNRDTTRRFSEYNVMDYSQFLRQRSALLGQARTRLVEDASWLKIEFGQAKGSEDPALVFDGQLIAATGQGGVGASVQVSSTGQLEVVAGDSPRTEGFDGISLSDSVLNDLARNAERLVLGGRLNSTFRANSNDTGLIQIRQGPAELVVRSGVQLLGREIILQSAGANGITLENGVHISSLGQGKVSQDASMGFRWGLEGAGLVVSNGIQVVEQSQTSRPSGGLHIGGSGSSDEGVGLYSEGSLVMGSDSSLTIDSSARYGTRHLMLALANVNLGSAAELAQAREEGRLPAGFDFDQPTLERLLNGDTSTGAPALESFTLGASQGLNVFGDVTLSTYGADGKSLLDTLVLRTPAILGAGNDDHQFTLETGHLVWDGGTQTPEVVAGGAGTGSGRFKVVADVIELGSGPGVFYGSNDSRDRTLLGFAEVVLQARQRFTTGHTGTLKVYQSRGDYVEGEGYSYQGGNLRIEAPRITGNAGADLSVTAGGDVLLTGLPKGVEAVEDKRDLTRDLGASLSFAGDRVTLDTEVLLPTGKLALKGQGDVVLTDNAVIDVAGRTLQYRDQRQYTWGGDVELESEQGRITTAAGSSIDLSATNSQGGTLKVTALGEQDGHVDLRGRIHGAVSGEYDAAGTRLPYAGAEVTVRAQTLADFAELNRRLNDEQVFGARRFQLKQGDLVVGDEVKAREVRIALDNGTLTVDGKIDASGLLTGTIELFARNGLTVTGRGVLDAHGTRLRVDSYGQIIDAVNRAQVLLSSGDGELVMEQGARVDLRHGVDAPRTGKGAHDGAERGTLTLIAPRRGADADGDVAVDIRGQVQVDGARRIDLLALRSYDDAPLDWDNADGAREQIINQAYLDQKHQDSTLFINAALRNDALRARFAGLRDGREQAFHLRPAVEIRSDTDDGKLVVQGDLDLSRYRYASLNPNTPMTGDYGSGEAGALTLRAGGDLEVLGSITDGFMAPPSSPDEKGRVLYAGLSPSEADVVLPRSGIVLDAGTRMPSGRVLNYDIVIKAFRLAAGQQLPLAMVLAQSLTLPAGTVLGGAVMTASGEQLPAGTLLSEPLELAAGSTLGAGMQLSQVVNMKGMSWQRGVALPMVEGGDSLPSGRSVELATAVALKRGALIPGQAFIKFQGGATEVLLDSEARPLWALASMLPSGYQSWDISLVAGADLAASDPKAIQMGSPARLRFSDVNYQIAGVYETEEKIVWAEGNGAGFEPGTEVDEEYLEYCELIPGWCTTASNMVWAEGNIFGMPAGEPVEPDYIDLCYMAEGVCEELPAPIKRVGALFAGNLPGVIRTGTGSLSLASGAGGVDVASLYGLYTAGSPASVPESVNRDRAPGGSVFGGKPYIDDYEQLVQGEGSPWQAWYPEQGGMFSLSTSGDLTAFMPIARDGMVGAPRIRLGDGGPLGLWMWRQGWVAGGDYDALPAAWWVNFGTYVSATTARGAGGSATLPNGGKPSDSELESIRRTPLFVGFNGLGTLGGGNTDIRVGGRIGLVDPRRNASSTAASQGVNLVAAATGYVTDGQRTLFGGGDLSVRAGGRINPYLPTSSLNGESAAPRQAWGDAQGQLVVLRGDATLRAAGVGIRNQVANAESGRWSLDDGATSPQAIGFGGLQLTPGDARISMLSSTDLVLGSVADATRVLRVEPQYFHGYVDPSGNEGENQPEIWFSLWSTNTQLNLATSGGSVFYEQLRDSGVGSNIDFRNSGASLGGLEGGSAGREFFPAGLSLQAHGGSIYLNSHLGPVATSQWGTRGVWLMPSSTGYLDMMARNSIYGRGAIMARTSYDVDLLALPETPAVYLKTGYTDAEYFSNVSNGLRRGAGNFRGLLREGVNAAPLGPSGLPNHIYALNGHISYLGWGESIQSTVESSTAYMSAGPLSLYAGGDLIEFNPEFRLSAGNLGGASAGLIFHRDISDTSSVEAGGRILTSRTQVAGPGRLDWLAGENMLFMDTGYVRSLGSLTAEETRPGASLHLMAGLAEAPLDSAGLLERFLDPAAVADSARPLADQPEKVVAHYLKELVQWLETRYGISTTEAEARDVLLGLDPASQTAFAREILFAELLASGREFNEQDGPRQGSYLRGRRTIDWAFAGRDPDSDARADITMSGAGHLRTLQGGDIFVLTPMGAQVYGIEGETPPAQAGVMTLGEGDIRLFARDSILLGQSRVMTLFGGDIQAWSERGDINAGRGTQSTQLFTPPRRQYDQWGNARLSPNAPSSGAGIATLNPVPGTEPGDVDLIAPLGTIDAGEAGIRVSGNVNIAALQVLNADNIDVQGESQGLPMLAAVDVGALSAASAASSAAAQAADAVNRQRERGQAMSVINVDVLGYGEQPLDPQGGGGPLSDAAPAVQVMGDGDLAATALAMLTAEERAGL